MARRRYTYLGDRMTDPTLVGRRCTAVLRADDKCILGRSAMLVLFDGEADPRVVQRRRLRKLPPMAGFPLLEDDEDEEDRRRTYLPPRRGARSRRR
jgi:hypothetical protein